MVGGEGVVGGWGGLRGGKVMERTRDETKSRSPNKGVVKCGRSLFSSMMYLHQSKSSFLIG